MVVAYPIRGAAVTTVEAVAAERRATALVVNVLVLTPIFKAETRAVHSGELSSAHSLLLVPCAATSVNVLPSPLPLPRTSTTRARPSSWSFSASCRTDFASSKPFSCSRFSISMMTPWTVCNSTTFSRCSREASVALRLPARTEAGSGPLKAAGGAPAHVTTAWPFPPSAAAVVVWSAEDSMAAVETSSVAGSFALTEPAEAATPLGVATATLSAVLPMSRSFALEIQPAAVSFS
mmetsp:Transcript_36426/g.90863  ORF Transcript_36426/g.90863 Transcript_36426/m.90863 type:complete len:235 (+) Transcript_36426:1654-2358(+)